MIIDNWRHSLNDRSRLKARVSSNLRLRLTMTLVRDKTPGISILSHLIRRKHLSIHGDVNPRSL